jgi:hypothetical protein
VTGGDDVGPVAGLRDTDEFNPGSNAWTNKTDIPTPVRINHGAAAIGTKGYIYGGGGLSNVADTDEYDPDTWTSKTNLPFARTRHAAF